MMLFMNEADRLTLNAAAIALGWDSLEDFLEEGIEVAEYPWVPKGTVIQGEWVSMKNLMRGRVKAQHLTHGLADVHAQGYGGVEHDIIEVVTNPNVVKSDSGPNTS